MRAMYTKLFLFLFLNYRNGLSDFLFTEASDIDKTVSPLIGQKNFNETFANAVTENTSLGRNNTPIFRYLTSDFHCVNNNGRTVLCLQVENKLRVTFSVNKFPRYIPIIRLVCQNAKSSLDINYDYFSILPIREEIPHALIVENCPILNYTYASLFSSKPNFALRTTGSIVVNTLIQNLTITCQQSKDYFVNKHHLEGLTRLRYLEIRCEALIELPEDLFRETTTDIEIIHIYDSGLKFIPEGLFHDLKNLKEVYLYNNSIAVVTDDAFKGCSSLRILRFDHNRLSYFSERSPGPFKSILQLNMANNQLKHFPKGLDEIETLNFAHNRLNNVDTADCAAFTKIRLIDLSYNNITRIDSTCFSSMPELIYLDVSGNSLSRLTEGPSTLKRLIYFFFNHNTGNQWHIKKFFICKSLLMLQMRNSSIISLEEDVLDGFPNLIYVDLGMNRISSIPVNLFLANKLIRVINLQGNRISQISPSLFLNNAMLVNVDVSYNNLESLPRNLISHGVNQSSLDIFWSDIADILKNGMRVNQRGGFIIFGNNKPQIDLFKRDDESEHPIKGQVSNSSLRLFNVSFNKIASLDNDTFLGLHNLEKVDFSYNMLAVLPFDIFVPLKDNSNFKEIHLQGNRLVSLWIHLELTNLEYLDISWNNLESIPEGTFYKLPRLKYLNISRNNLKNLKDEPIVEAHQLLHTLDLSYNMLQVIPSSAIVYLENLKNLNFSHNKIEEICFLFFVHLKNITHVNLSSNRIASISCENDSRFLKYSSYTSLDVASWATLRVLDLSNNNLVLGNSQKEIDMDSLTWGSLSPFRFFPNLEVLLLSNNSIKEIYLDWRIYMPRLQHIDLRYNKIEYIAYQDMLFSTISHYEKSGFGRYSCSYNTTVDLRYNQIRGVEFPTKMLEVQPNKNESKGFYGHATIMIDENPLECGCHIFNLLRILHYDVALRSDLFLSKGEKWILPATVEVGNLSCSKPASIRGKKLNAIEEWIHHLLPMIAMCSLAGIPIY